MEVKKKKILLIDDDRLHLKETTAYLEVLGYEVATAEDGCAGLKLVREFNPNLVVLDLESSDHIKQKLQGMDGLEVLRILREAGDVPVIVLSGTTITSMKSLVLSLGANDFMYKPFDLQELSKRIAALVSEAKSA